MSTSKPDDGPAGKRSGLPSERPVEPHTDETGETALPPTEQGAEPAAGKGAQPAAERRAETSPAQSAIPLTEKDVEPPAETGAGPALEQRPELSDVQPADPHAEKRAQPDPIKRAERPTDALARLLFGRPGRRPGQPYTHSRRGMLQLIGGGAIIAASGVGMFLSTRTPVRALEPWEAAGSDYEDPRLDALSYAILAPNPHNRQPWLVRLEGDDGFSLFLDPERRLPHTDPFDRQLVIGLGCFLELARMAAAARGFRLELRLFPEGEPEPVVDERPVASAMLTPASGEPDPLFAHVLARRSCKEPYDLERPVPAAALSELGNAMTPGASSGDSAFDDRSLREGGTGVAGIGDSGLREAGFSRSDVDHPTFRGVRFGGTVSPPEVASLRELAWRAHVLEAETPRTLQESVDLMRIGKSEIEANPDGIDLGGPFLESLALLGMLSREGLADPGSDAFQQGMDMYRSIFDNTPAFVWLRTEGNTRRQQIAAGRSWLRLNLATTAAGLALHPVSQALQEYAEMAPLFHELHERIGGGTDERVQMFGRLGYGPGSPPSPRWPLTDRIAS